jgi:predicted nucleic-acid-binding Zn-ribbon protein
MTAAEVEVQARVFFDEFVEAFRSFNGKVIAQRYLSPYLAFHTAESTQVFMTGDETASYFQGIVEEYYAKGCRACRYKDMSVAALGGGCAVGTVTWELLAEDQSVVSAWRESYNLCLVQGRFMVFTSTDHAA